MISPAHPFLLFFWSENRWFNLRRFLLQDPSPVMSSCSASSTPVSSSLPGPTYHAFQRKGFGVSFIPYASLSFLPPFCDSFVFPVKILRSKRGLSGASKHHFWVRPVKVSRPVFYTGFGFCRQHGDQQRGAYMNSKGEAGKKKLSDLSSSGSE
jgi:hypothetical protein